MEAHPHLIPRLIALGLLALAACRSDKTPELEREWKLGGVELRAPAWRPVLRDADPSAGMLRLRPRQVPSLLGMSLRWDALDAAAVKSPYGRQVLAGVTREALRGHFMGELRLPSEMVQVTTPPTGAPTRVHGHLAEAIELKVAESQVGVSALTWYCPETGRQLLFEVHHEGRDRLRHLLLARTAETVHCHGPGAVRSEVTPVPVRTPEGWRPRAAGAPAGFSAHEGPDGQTLLVAPPRALAERRGADPAVAGRETAWALFPALEGVRLDRVEPVEGPAGHPAVRLSGLARDDEGQKKVGIVALRWDCPHRRRTVVAAVTQPSLPTPADLERATRVLQAVRCHGE